MFRPLTSKNVPNNSILKLRMFFLYNFHKNATDFALAFLKKYFRRIIVKALKKINSLISWRNASKPPVEFKKKLHWVLEKVIFKNPNWVEKHSIKIQIESLKKYFLKLTLIPWRNTQLWVPEKLRVCFKATLRPWKIFLKHSTLSPWQTF